MRSPGAGTTRATAPPRSRPTSACRLREPVRAFLVLRSIGPQPVGAPAAREALGRLAEATGRHEDLLALLDVAARAGSPLETRRAALRRRRAVCEEKLGDPERAF